MIVCVCCHSGAVEGVRPAQTEAVCNSTRPTTVPQLPASGTVPLHHLETHETPHTGLAHTQY